MKLRNRLLIVLFRLHAAKAALLSNQFDIKVGNDSNTRTALKFDKKEILKTRMSSTAEVKEYLLTLLNKKSEI